MDVLVNVESSHTYPDLGKFLREVEVERVLRPGGILTHLDVFTRERYATMRRVAGEVDGLDWISDHDIPDKVREAVRRRMAADSHSRKVLAQQRVNPLMRHIVGHQRILIYGGTFAGYQPPASIKVLHKLGLVPRMSGLPMETYRHQVAVRR